MKSLQLPISYPKVFGLGILLTLTGIAGAQTNSLRAQVRQARETSNRAIAERTVDAYAATVTSDFVITTGSGKTADHDAFISTLTKMFNSSDFGGCVRTPDRIDISFSKAMASERGHFRCKLQQSDGMELYSGTYLAMWVRDLAVWKTRSELFVTLACTGSAKCATPAR